MGVSLSDFRAWADKNGWKEVGEGRFNLYNAMGNQVSYPTVIWYTPQGMKAELAHKDGEIGWQT